jgi:hypothetical protein
MFRRRTPKYRDWAGAEGVYGPVFERANFARLASLLKSIRSRFILI